MFEIEIVSHKVCWKMDTIDNLSELIYSYQSKPPVTILQEICSKLVSLINLKNRK